MENNGIHRRTDTLLMRLKKRIFGGTVIRYNLRTQTFSTLDRYSRFTTPPPPAKHDLSKFEEWDVISTPTPASAIGQQVKEAAAPAASVSSPVQPSATKKKRFFCFRTRKSRRDAGRTASAAEDQLQSRLLSQEQKIRDMEEERRNMVVLVDMLRTKINAMEKDKELRKFQLLNMGRRLVDMEERMMAVLEEEANLVQKGRQQKDTLSQ